MSVALLVAGVTAIELLVFVAFQLAFAFLPGLLSYLLLVGRPRLLADCLTLAIPFGLAIQIGCFVLSAAIGERWLFSIYPALFVLATAPLLYRQRATLTPTQWVKTPWALTRMSTFVVLILVIGAALVFYLTLFATSPLPRET
ncbi:MAG TPA: hypothetical protein VNU24_07630, partial [Solirubrobacteraceae bacterium]|nr:hypothetical protein [Solirubrobacteraceae bacterium]